MSWPVLWHYYVAVPHSVCSTASTAESGTVYGIRFEAYGIKALLSVSQPLVSNNLESRRLLSKLVRPIRPRHTIYLDCDSDRNRGPLRH